MKPSRIIPRSMVLCLSAFLLFPALRPATVTAHLIYLKDGQRIQTDKVWEAAGFIKYQIPGGSLGVRKETVDKIVYEDLSAPSSPPKPAPVVDLLARLAETVKPKNPIEGAVLATVTIVSPVSKASGFFISRDGHLLTNKHVLQIDRGDLDAMDAKIGEQKKQLARMAQQLRARRKSLDEDEQWLSRNKEALAALNRKRKFASKRLAMRNIDEVNALSDAYNSRLDAYYRNRAQYDDMVRVHNDRKQQLDRAVQEKNELGAKATSGKRPYIVLADGTELDVAVIRESKRYDVALLKLNGYHTPFLVPGDPGGIAVSAPVYAIGNPTGERPNTVSAGTLKNIIAPGILSRRDGVFLQSDAKIYPGNSGGPLIDSQGRVLGINTMKEVTRKFEGLGYALSIRMAVDEFRDIVPEVFSIGPDARPDGQ